MKVAIEYIEWLQKERGRINKENIDNIEFFRNGMKLELPKDIMEEFKFSGLINTDILRFINED